MNIDTTNTVKTNTAGTGRTANATVTNRSDKSGASAQSADSVALSPEAQTLGRLSEAIDSASGVDSERVDAIKQAITEGRFEINADRLAEAMLAQEELLG